MKPIKCSKCGKIAEVEDSWSYTRCEICRMKDLAYMQVLKDRRKLDRESRNKIKELRLEKALSFSEWSKLAKEKFNNPNPNWEQYLEFLKRWKEREIFDRADREIYRLRAENKAKYALINQELYPLSNERGCYSFRLSRLNGSEDIRHLSTCENCRDWNYAFVNDVLPEPQDENDVSEPIDSIERWEVEQWRNRGATIPDDSLDRFKSKQEPENRDPSQISYQPLKQSEPSRNEPRPEQLNPTSSRDDLNNILIEHDQRKKRGSEETQNNEN